jgi:hypothetical protein
MQIIDQENRQPEPIEIETSTDVPRYGAPASWIAADRLRQPLSVSVP